MKVTTWNVNGIRARETQVMQWVNDERPDVLAVQEMKALPEQVPAPLRSLDGYWCAWHGHKGYSGVGLLLRRDTFPDEPTITIPPFDFETRIVTAQVGDVLFASVYVPNGGKDFAAKVRFLEAFEAFAADARARGLRPVICGDFNVTREERDVHPLLRKPTEIGQTPGERAMLARILDGGLADLGRRFAPDDDGLFTWWAPWRNMRERNVGWRLDYVLTAESLARHATGCVVHPRFGTSDHAPVTATFATLG